jgi:hypothetical protein
VPSLTDLLRRALSVAAILLATTGAHAAGAIGTAAAPDAAAISQALEEVQKDPNLGGERQMRVLRWAGKDEPARRESAWSGLLQWLTGLFRWLGESARYVVYVAAALLAGMLGVFLYRLLRTRGLPAHAPAFEAPSHVRDLDIRPESFPADIGAAARELWDAAQHRGALALLYRGLLSRLVHVHGVPIRASSTEGDCLGLAATHLRSGAGDYGARLIRVWQRAVYGGADPDTGTVHGLCADFAAALDP